MPGRADIMAKHKPLTATTLRTASGRVVTLPAPVVADHELLQEIGQGAYGRVWLARNVMGYRAVKVIYRAALETERPFEREFEGLKRFEPVSRTHPGLMPILQAGRNDAEGYFYYVMELADGQSGGPLLDNPDDYQPKTLRSQVDQLGRLPPKEVVRIGLALCDALGFLHRGGLVHRDIKPGNIVFVNSQPKLADIGLVTEIGERSIVGTPGYMPPEQPGKPQGDLFSLGKVLYVAATGMAVAEFPKLPENTTLEEDPLLWELNQIWLKAAANDPAERYQTAEEMQLHLSFLLAGQSVIAHLRIERFLRRARRYAPLVLLLLGLAAGGVHLRDREQKQAGARRQREVGALVARGVSAMRAGEYLAALPPLAGALRLEDGDPVRAATHRARIAAVLGAAPRLRQMWFAERPQMAIQFTRDGRRLLLGGPDRRTHLYRTEDGGVDSPALDEGLPEEQAVLSPDDRLAATFTDVGTDPMIGLWDVASGTRLRQMQPQPNTRIVGSVRFSPDGRLLAAGRAAGDISLCDPETGVELGQLKGHTDKVIGLAFDPGGQRLVSASRDGTARVWDVAARRQLRVFSGHSSWVYNAVFSPDGTAVASVSYDRTLRIWEAATGRELLAPVVHPDAVRSVAFSPDGARVATACLGFEARVWDARTGRPESPTLHHSSRVYDLAFSPDGRRLATACWDGTVRLWEFGEPRPECWTNGLALSPDGRISASTEGRVVTVCEGIGGRRLSQFELPGRPSEPLRFDWRGEVLLAVLPGRGARPGEASLWSAAAGRPQGKPIELGLGMTNLALCPGGALLAAAASNQVVVFDTRSGTRQGALPLAGREGAALVFSADGRRLAVRELKTFQVYTVPELRPVFRPPPGSPMPYSCAGFSPDSRWVVAAWSDATLDPGGAGIWDALNGGAQRSQLPHRDGVRCAQFSPDSRSVLTGCEDYTAMIWSVPEGRPLLPDRIRERGNLVRVAYGAGGRWVCTAGEDGQVRVLDARTGDPVTPALPHPGKVSEVQFVAGARALVTRTEDGRSWVWPLPQDPRPAEDLAELAHLLAAHQIDGAGSLRPQSKKATQQSWERLRARYPRMSAGE